ncbi:glycosyltransferase family A protein [Niallia sp. MER 6]|uniref:glycosyltransferase family A protein n=1 Tax=Niallia sp. MER 6 TaxID=2939567 RepID=UPI00203B59B2|nr:glycosyltransferase family A protein [Niallia sp. MER 6]MCM3033900.1 glycosyltransferase family 2 protein [Niallia sp. MER 6]
MIFFAIPLRSKQTTNNWDKIQKIFNITLRSIYEQLDPNFKVLVACHEIPNLDIDTDDRLEFIQVDFPTPNNWVEQVYDKAHKKRYLAKRIRELGGGHVMFVDADDIVSNKISQFVNENSEEAGWIINYGYSFDVSSKKVQMVPQFYRLCGTCAIMHLDKEDLPDTVTYEHVEQEREFIFDYSHSEWQIQFENKKKKKLKSLPFFGAIYITNTGENISTDHEGTKRKLFKKLLPSYKPTYRVHKSFPVLENYTSPKINI